MGQAPIWRPDGSGFVYARKDANGKNQVWTANLDHSNETCLTCDLPWPGPNHVPQYRPQGDKILFHSWGTHMFQFGSPGYAGVGSNFFVIHPDGSSVVNLSNGEEGEDNFHAYWSPDGTKIAWTHIAWDIESPGNHGLWSVRVADYVDDASGPHLANVQTVRPENGHFYETQWWSPDGRGFLYTESVDNALNLELFFYDLDGTIKRLTNDPAWDEQAVFNKDGDKVIFMSTRGEPSDWQTWAAASYASGLTPGLDYLLITPLFFGLFFSPVDAPSTDLYEVDWATNATRRLTHEGADGWIIPEFAWDPTRTKLLWTEQKTADWLRVSGQDDPVVEVLQATNPQPPSAVAPEAFLTARTVIGSYTCP